MDYSEPNRLTFSMGGTIIATGITGGGTAVLGVRSVVQGFETEAVHGAHYHELKEPTEHVPPYESGPLMAGAGALFAAYKVGQSVQHAWDRFGLYVKSDRPPSIDEWPTKRPSASPPRSRRSAK